MSWEETAREHLTNQNYYHGLLVNIAEQLGEESYIADDGSKSQEVLVAKLPKLVEKKLKGVAWRNILMRVLKGVAEAEGYWFESKWGLSEETIKMVENEYTKWLDENNIQP